jgi:DNA mismatch endonuclease, patch repair protein
MRWPPTFTGVDRLTRKRRSALMARVNSKDTTPEVVVRRILSDLGVRYRLNVRRLPGKPDIVIHRLRLVILIHGCFWHRHEGCRRCTTPKSNISYWAPKFQRNVERDVEVATALGAEGWHVRTIWECETLHPGRKRSLLRQRLRRWCRSDRTSYRVARVARGAEQADARRGGRR